MAAIERPRASPEPRPSASPEPRPSASSELRPQSEAARSAGPAELRVTIGQHSARGRKSENQDSFGASVPRGRALALKGAALAIADGISSSEVGREAAEAAVLSFLADYYCTPDGWSVKTSGQCVIAAANTWLHAQSQRFGALRERGRGYVCTFSALIVKGRKAHVFHVGDSRVWQLHANGLEPLTTDHRVTLSSEESYLARALGLAAGVEIEYRELALRPGDLFVLSTDGVHEHVSGGVMAETIAQAADLDEAVRHIVERAFDGGSMDNLTVQIVRIESLAPRDASDFLDGSGTLPPAPLLEVGAVFEGYRILRALHASARSHIYLAVDTETGAEVAIKCPSIDLRGDPMYLRRFAMEEWVARRVRSPHVLGAPAALRERRHLYVVTDYLAGQTLRQWMIDNPVRELETVRRIVLQIAKGLQALHRRETIHQDLRPENLLIDAHGTVTIIDFGSVRVAGVVEAAPGYGTQDILGTVQYSAPEYFLGHTGSEQSDLFSLGVIAYELITGRLPYGAAAARARTAKEQGRLRYRSAESTAYSVPEWIDAALAKAVHPGPRKRYAVLSELMTDLQRPNPAYVRDFVPLAERDPVRFWQVVAAALALLGLFLLLRGGMGPPA